MAYLPDRRDIVWLSFSPQAGHEQAGRRPAIVISPASYNGRVGMGLFCTITRQAKGYPFEVLLPPGLAVSGVVLADQLSSLDWQARDVELIDHLPEQVLLEVIGKLNRLITGEV
jgi:mRNA interferase MazF